MSMPTITRRLSSSLWTMAWRSVRPANHPGRHVVMATSVVLLGAVSVATTLCQQQQQQEQEQEQEDKYENLPEEDSPTSCTICLVNRQGPCRPFWRKFEHCMNDHADDANDANDANGNGRVEVCDRYMTPLVDCWQQHPNIYILLTNQVIQKQSIDVLEDSLQDIVWQPQESVELHHDNLQAFMENHDLDVFEQNEKQEEEKDPVLIRLEASIALYHAETQWPIEIAYAKDQNGNLLGFQRFIRALEEEETERAPLPIWVQPTRTQSIVLYQVYRKNPPDEEAPLAYKSQPIHLVELAKAETE